MRRIAGYSLWLGHVGDAHNLDRLHAAGILAVVEAQLRISHLGIETASALWRLSALLITRPALGDCFGMPGDRVEASAFSSAMMLLRRAGRTRFGMAQETRKTQVFVFALLGPL